MAQREASFKDRRLLPIWLLAALALGLFGCGILERFRSSPQACTLLACVDSLVFDLSGRVPDEFTLEATSPDGPAWLVRCAGGDVEVTGPLKVVARVQCRPGSVVFFEFAPEEISLQITWGGGEIERTARPEYEAVRPNGPDCPPECRVGHVSIEFP